LKLYSHANTVSVAELFNCCEDAFLLCTFSNNQKITKENINQLKWDFFQWILKA